MGIAERVKRQQDVDALREAPPDGSVQRTESKDGTVSVEYVEHEHRHLKDEERAAALGFDPNVWEIVEAGAWNGQMKLTGSNESGATWSKPVVVWMYRYRFRRKVPRHVEIHIEKMLAGYKPPKAPRTPARYRKTGDHVLLPSPYDVHVGKFAYGIETGGRNQDTRLIAERGAAGFTEVVEHYGRETFVESVVPFGNDWCHIDNMRGITPRGTQLEYDSRFSKVYDVAFDLAVLLVETLLKLAPVKMLYVPGNHDPHTSYFILREMRALYARNKHVTFDLAPEAWKHHTFGVTTFSFHHGDTIKKPVALANAASVKNRDWSVARFREVHTGHLHTQETKIVRLDDTEIHGTRIRRLPSLSETDAWHAANNYFGNIPALLAFSYHRDYGFRSLFESRVRDDGNS